MKTLLSSLLIFLNFFLLVLVLEVPKKLKNSTLEDLKLLDQNERATLIEWLSQFSSIFGATTEAPEILQEPEYCAPCSCGITNVKNRIVGGHETIVNQYPWVVLLLYSNKFYCGGSLITDLHVLTAAHCTAGLTKERITVRINEHDRYDTQETETITRKVKKVYRHPKYSSYSYDNDIAILKLDQRVPMKNNLRTVCLPPGGETFAGYEGIVTGWGATSESGSLSPKLREVQVPIMTQEECYKSAYGKDRITSNMLCAGYKEGKMDACQGDSGGPLHVIYNKATSIHKQVGIVSWGEGCAQPDHPGVYSRVSVYKQWIREKTIDGCFCEDEIIIHPASSENDTEIIESNNIYSHPDILIGK